jgi:predicted RNA-binding Zn ribbon-like protein
MAPQEPSGGLTALVPATRAELCLDFANTLCWRGSDSPSEALANPDELLAWCAAVIGADPAIDRLAGRWRSHPGRAQAAFTEAIELREVIYRIFSAIAGAGEPSLADLEKLNRALATAPARTRLASSGGRYAWQVERLTVSVTHLLAPVLWSAGDLLTGPGLRRVRQCVNNKCLWLFLDDSKSGTRRWCSMSTCGNRAKAHRYYLKTKRG